MTEWEMFLFLGQRLGAAMLCGGIIGMERQIRHKSAGLKTMTLVCMGSTLFTAMSYLDGFKDPHRTTAQIVSGVGFLGAGAIMQGSEKISGLTTAALMWVVAALGVIIGEGHLAIGCVASLCIVTLLYSISKLEDIFWKRN